MKDSHWKKGVIFHSINYSHSMHFTGLADLRLCDLNLTCTHCLVLNIYNITQINKNTWGKFIILWISVHSVMGVMVTLVLLYDPYVGDLPLLGYIRGHTLVKSPRKMCGWIIKKYQNMNEWMDEVFWYENN